MTATRSATQHRTNSAIIWMGVVIIGAYIICVAWPLSVAQGKDVNGNPLIYKWTCYSLLAVIAASTIAFFVGIFMKSGDIAAWGLLAMIASTLALCALIRIVDGGPDHATA